MTSGYVPIPNPDAESGERTHAPAPVWMPRALRRTVLIISLVGISALLGVLYVSSASGSGRNVAAELAAASASATVPDMDTVDAPGALALLRDPTPGATAQRFWRLAEAEIAALGVDTCNNKLGRPLVDAYARHKVQFCGEPFVFAPSETGVHEHWHPTRRAGRRQVDYEESAEHEPESTETEPTEPSVKKEQEYRASVLCMPVQQDDFTRWWPYPTSPCVSRNLQPSRNGEGVGEQFEALCPATREGKQLLEEMGRETFLGNRLDIVDAAQACTERVEHTLLVIHRQDQWNPFHVAEDLVTTLVTLFIAAASVPGIEKERLQLVFTDNYGMDKNHFTPLYNRIGAWAPRRLTLDPWRKGECLSTAIHSVGAGASLLSAIGVGTSSQCASSITWAASHYYRHLFGLTPPGNRQGPRSINVLYLSRASLDAIAQAEHDMSAWRASRHLENVDELIERLREGLRAMCASGSCVFEDERDVPESWAATATVPTLRFAAIDPTVHALESQIHYAGHSDVLVGQHGGALGLSLFLPPAHAAVVELQVNGVVGNYHFEHMAYQTGQRYEVVGIKQLVDVDKVWRSVEGHVKALRG